MDQTSIPWSGEAELVVPLDGRHASVRAVPVAGRLAERFSSSVRLLGVVSSPDQVADRQLWLDTVAADLLGEVSATTEVVIADDHVEAIASLAASGDRLLCMATAGSLRPHEGHFGSVAEAVARRVARPLFLVGPQMEPHPGEHTRRVVVPVDGSPLSETALVPAATLAARFDVPLWVVTVVSPGAESAAAARLGSGVLAGETGYVRRLAETLGDEYPIDAEYEVLHLGDPAAAIVDFVGGDGTAVMSTHGRSGVNRLFAGSVATSVVAHSRRAVVVWRPEEPAGQ